MKEKGIQLHGVQEIMQVLSAFSGELSSLSGEETVRRRFAEKFAAHAVVLTLPGDNGPAAFGAFYCNDTAEKQAYLSMFAVSAACRRQGYGRKMLEEVCAFCRRRGMQTLELEVARTNEAAIGLYRKMGFSPTGKETPHSIYLSVCLENV